MLQSFSFQLFFLTAVFIGSSRKTPPHEGPFSQIYSHFHILKYRKILKISPSKYKPPQNHEAKNPPLNCPSEYKPPPGGLYLEFALKYKVKQSKNGEFPSHYKLALSILKRKFSSEYKPLQKRAFEKYKSRGLFSEFYGIC